jgi:virginiamycin B lyase
MRSYYALGIVLTAVLNASCGNDSTTSQQLAGSVIPQGGANARQVLGPQPDLSLSNIVYHTVPTGNAQAESIIGGPDGAIWFYETLGEKIGMISEGGSFAEYPLPNNDSQAAPDQITQGGPDFLWFQAGNGIYKITTKGVITLEMPGPRVYYQGIALGPDGNVWAATNVDLGQDYIIRFSTKNKTYTTFPTPTSNANPTCMTVGPDGNMWFLESDINHVAKITMSGVITEYPLQSGSYPSCIITADDGYLYAGDEFARVFHRISTDGVVTEYQTKFDVIGLGQGPQHKLWLAVRDVSHPGGIQLFDTRTQTFSDILHLKRVVTFAEDRDRNVWFIGAGGQEVDEYDRPY